MERRRSSSEEVEEKKEGCRGMEKRSSEGRRRAAGEAWEKKQQGELRGALWCWWLEMVALVTAVWMDDGGCGEGEEDGGAGGWMGGVGAPPRRPGRGGGQSWRRMGEGERDMPGPMGNGADLGILIPSMQILMFAHGPSYYLLPSQVDPLSSIVIPFGYFLSSHTSPSLFSLAT